MDAGLKFILIINLALCIQDSTKIIEPPIDLKFILGIRMLNFMKSKNKISNLKKKEKNQLLQVLLFFGIDILSKFILLQF